MSDWEELVGRTYAERIARERKLGAVTLAVIVTVFALTEIAIVAVAGLIHGILLVAFAMPGLVVCFVVSAYVARRLRGDVAKQIAADLWASGTTVAGAPPLRGTYWVSQWMAINRIDQSAMLEAARASANPAASKTPRPGPTASIQFAGGLSFLGVMSILVGTVFGAVGPSNIEVTLEESPSAIVGILVVSVVSWSLVTATGLAATAALRGHKTARVVLTSLGIIVVAGGLLIQTSSTFFLTLIWLGAASVAAGTAFLWLPRSSRYFRVLDGERLEKRHHTNERISHTR